MSKLPLWIAAFTGCFAAALPARGEPDPICYLAQYEYGAEVVERFDESHKISIFQIRAGGETGTGFMITERVALTSGHAVTESDGDGALVPRSRIEVFFPDLVGTRMGSARVIGHDPAMDIALLDIDIANAQTLPGLPIHIDRYVRMRSGDVLSYGFGLKRFGEELVTPFPGRLASSPSGNVINYTSVSGDSGAPVVSKTNSHVIGMHLGRFSGYDSNKFVSAQQIGQFLIRHFPDEMAAEYLDRLRDEPRELLYRGFKPTDCGDRCWENAEIAKVAMMLDGDDAIAEEFDADVLECPLRVAAQARQLSTTVSRLDRLLDLRMANGQPTQRYLDDARRVIQAAFTQPAPADESARFELALELAQAEIVMADAGIARLGQSWPQTAGRFCTPDFAPASTYSLRSLVETSGAAERLTGIDGALQAVADPASCGGGPGDEQASRLFFDAATAARLRADLVGPESGVFGLTATDASAAPVYYAASYGLTDNILRAYESLRGLSLTVQQVDPALALRSTASAYGLAIDVASDARDYDYLWAKTYDRLPFEAQASLPVSLQGVAPGDLTPNQMLDARTAVGVTTRSVGAMERGLLGAFR